MSEINDPTSDSPIDEFARIYQGRAYLQQQIATSPALIKHILQDGIDTADARLAELAADPTVRDYYTSEAAQAYEAIRQLDVLAPTLQALGMQERVDATRREIEEKNGMALYAASYFVGQTVEVAPVDESGLSAEETSEKQPDTGEFDPNKLVILVDNNGHIRIGDQVISLRRSVEVSSDIEPEFVRWRLEGLKYLATNKGQRQLTTDVWRAVNPGLDYAKKGNQWIPDVIDFFRELQTPDGQPIVHIERTSAASKRVYCRVDLDIDFQEAEEKLQTDNEGVYIFANGKAVGGITGTVLHLFSKATKENPETLENVSHLFDEEWLKDPYITSQAASMARSSIRLAGADDQLKIHKVLTGRFHATKSPEGIRRSIVGYYLEDLTKPESVIGETDSHSADLEAEAETEPESQSLSLHEATVFAAFLNHYRGELAKHGIAPLPAEIYDLLNSKVVETYTDGEISKEQLCRLRRSAFEKAIALIENSEALNVAYTEYEEASNQDPRADLLIWLMDLTVDQNSVIKDLLDSQPEVRVSYDTGRRKGFLILNVESKVIPNAQRRPVK